MCINICIDVKEQEMFQDFFRFCFPGSRASTVYSEKERLKVTTTLNAFEPIVVTRRNHTTFI